MFYTYLWLRENGIPYYVGKGSGDRSHNPNGHRVKKPDDDRIIVQKFECEETAFFAETFLIALYGRTDKGTGCLSNLTDGGENPPSWKGRKRTEENVRKSVEARTGMKRTAEQRLRISEAHKGQVPWIIGKKHSEASKQKNRESHLGTTHFQPKKTHCKNGHELVVSAYVNPNTGNRHCGVCKAEWSVKNKTKLNAKRKERRSNKKFSLVVSAEVVQNESASAFCAGK
jgi:hypothetical protein